MRSDRNIENDQIKKPEGHTCKKMQKEDLLLYLFIHRKTPSSIANITIIIFNISSFWELLQRPPFFTTHVPDSPSKFIDQFQAMPP